jgi:hypothetical protein
MLRKMFSPYSKINDIKMSLYLPHDYTIDFIMHMQESDNMKESLNQLYNLINHMWLSRLQITLWMHIPHTIIRVVYDVFNSRVHVTWHHWEFLFHLLIQGDGWFYFLNQVSCALESQLKSVTSDLIYYI